MTQLTRRSRNHIWRQMVVTITVTVVLAAAQATTAQPRLTADDIERIAQTVVRITALRNGESIGTGSGTVFSSTGLIVTNRHVIENSDDWEIALLENINERPVPRYRASLGGYSEEVDFAVLRIDRSADGRPLISTTLDLQTTVPALRPLRRGDYVGLLGYPGIGGGLLTFTEGTITTVHSGPIAGEATSIAYQTDAEIAPGNSGGLAVNSNGEMVGIPSSAMTEATGGRLGVIVTLDALARTTSAGLETELRNSNNSLVDPSAEALYGTLLVQPGARPEGHAASGIAGGPIDVGNVIDGCNGWISTRPDYRTQWTGGTESLGIAFAADEDTENTTDTTLTVRTPNGHWFCDDDSADGLDPFVFIENPAPGDYTVWAGSYEEDAYIEGTLFVLDSGSLEAENPARRDAAPNRAGVPRRGGSDRPIRVFMEPGPHSANALAEAYDRRECTTGHLQVVADPRLADVGVYIGVQPAPAMPPTGDPTADAGRALGALIALGARGRNQVTVYTMADGRPSVVLYSGRTRRFGNAVKDACNAILDAAGVWRGYTGRR